jgi:hypothetical protein
MSTASSEVYLIHILLLECTFRTEITSTCDNTIYIKPALNGNIFRSRDFVAERDVKYPGLNGNSNAETEIKISLHTENFQSSGMHCL